MNCELEALREAGRTIYSRDIARLIFFGDDDSRPLAALGIVSEGRQARTMRADWPMHRVTARGDAAPLDDARGNG